MVTYLLKKNTLFKTIIFHAGNARANKIAGKIQAYLNKKDNILDIGSGIGNVCDVLSKKGYKTTPLDVQNLSVVPEIKPIIYNGDKIPFKTGAFDASLLLTVLHHTKEPETILQEAKRVSSKIILIEDIYVNRFHKYITYFFDSLINLEFKGHPHSNKSDIQWKKAFKKIGLTLVDAKYSYSFFVFKHAIYHLEKRS